MPNLSASIVVTTISDSQFLDAYLANLEEFGRLDEAEIIVIPDRKTPDSLRERARALACRGLRVRCPSLDEQEKFLAKVGVPPSMVPWNSDNRRNVGYLMALESGSDFLVSLDDDNFCRPHEDFLAGHGIVAAEPASHSVTESATAFLNVCGLLEFDRPIPIYPRGFPYYARHREEKLASHEERRAIHCNAGMWLLDPDVDGITWLVAKPHASAFGGRSVVLGPQTWSPINSQNTALRREAIPAYYFIRMGYPLAGLAIDRYGDVFAGYFLEACSKHLGGAVRFGTPIVDHRRSSHQYLGDATREWACILVLEDLLPWLTQARLSGSSYTESYDSLGCALEDAVEGFQGSIWTDTARAYFHQMAYSMRTWNKACRTILGQ